MTELLDLQRQIELLTKQAETIKSKQRGATLLDIQAKMKAFDITLEDLKNAMGNPAPEGKRRGRKPSAEAAEQAAPAPARRGRGSSGEVKSRGIKKGSKIEPKYRGPNGETWTGRGVTPNWMKAAIENGATRDDFLIESVVPQEAVI